MRLTPLCQQAQRSPNTHDLPSALSESAAAPQQALSKCTLCLQTLKRSNRYIAFKLKPQCCDTDHRSVNGPSKKYDPLSKAETLTYHLQPLPKRMASLMHCGTQARQVTQQTPSTLNGNVANGAQSKTKEDTFLRHSNSRHETRRPCQQDENRQPERDRAGQPNFKTFAGDPNSKDFDKRKCYFWFCLACKKHCCRCSSCSLRCCAPAHDLCIHARYKNLIGVLAHLGIKRELPPKNFTNIPINLSTTFPSPHDLSHPAPACLSIYWVLPPCLSFQFSLPSELGLTVWLQETQSHRIVTAPEGISAGRFTVCGKVCPEPRSSRKTRQWHWQSAKFLNTDLNHEMQWNAFKFNQATWFPVVVPAWVKSSTRRHSFSLL